MPITINGSTGIAGVDGSASTPAIQGTDTNTGIYFPGADRVGITEGGTQVGEFDASGNFKFNSGYGSVATAYGCRAWVNFNGTLAAASMIRASGNVSSITDHGVGDYTVNFTTAMPDGNYAVQLARGGLPATGFIIQKNDISQPAAGSVRISCVNQANTALQDTQETFVAIFR